MSGFVTSPYLITSSDDLFITDAVTIGGDIILGSAQDHNIGISQPGGNTDGRDLNISASNANRATAGASNGGNVRINPGGKAGTGVDGNVILAQIGKVGIGTISPTEVLQVTGNISASGNIVGNQLHVTHHNMSSVDAAENYIPGIATSEGDSVSYQRQWVAPFDGSLEKIRLYASSAGGNTVCKLYVNAVFADGATSTSDTVSVSATTTATFTFSSGNTYSAGDLIRVTVDPTNRLDDVNLTCIWKYNTNTL